MKVVIVHNAVTVEDGPDARDVLDQARAVEAALEALGHKHLALGCDLNLGALRDRLLATGPDLVFNLVESLDGLGRLIHLAPALYEALGLPFTGASSQAQWLTSGKLPSKARLREAALPTPPWFEGREGEALVHGPAWIVKSAWEHASLGLDADSVVRTNEPEELARLIAQRTPALGGQAFAEHFIPGREFNLALLAGPGGPLVLPPAEILFQGFAADQPRIVDYAAKWIEDSHGYQHTPRRYDFPDADQPLIEELRRLALACWELFALRGYARVDFRVDNQGRPWILEVNANPCLSPDAGFAAALERAGIAMTEAIAKILADALPPATPGATSHRSAAPTSQDAKIEFRYEVRPGDGERIRHLVARTGFFNAEEIAVAQELVEERLLRGEASGYFFVLAEQDGDLAGYACHGPIPCTVASHDLYWIAVNPALQQRGLGRALMSAAQDAIRARGGHQVYVDTSERALYAPTRAFYQRCGYRIAYVLPNFYAPGDGKVIFVKALK